MANYVTFSTRQSLCIAILQIQISLERNHPYALHQPHSMSVGTP